jgi:hypothetical protein
VAFTVPGTANPFLTGYSSGGSVIINGVTDTAPAESPIYIGSVSGGETVTFSSVTGNVGNCAGCNSPDANGGASYSSAGGTTVGGYNNFPINALVGVFYDPSAAQGSLNSLTATLTPEVNQVFFIGTGSLGAYLAPTGATGLYLGTVDGYEWNNNVGSISGIVTVNASPGPIPGTGLLSFVVLALGGILVRMRNSKDANS